MCKKSEHDMTEGSAKIGMLRLRVRLNKEDVGAIHESPMVYSIERFVNRPYNVTLISILCRSNLQKIYFGTEIAI
ncbi:hypothetical protein HNQ80_001641 [Anaerosolibacter carboniphilus]|uniref:Uncharacterized protein n=1 Tax=Anaerosolibacter carboniphilus TaxID=1417629 RepID=A0A841KX89_9FIRM|nr:hypothetical protein [Anaerosolibacter carboniphilus]MBB6215552.1 hypothetical protein [Anaerosolibacter carboniphilus]